MALTSVSALRHEPLSDINTTPLVDVMLVLLVMLIFTIPMATHSLDVDLPRARPLTELHPVKNVLEVTAAGELVWNGRSIGDAELTGLLAGVRAMRPEPEVQFKPEANASYERAAHVLRIVKASGVSRFGFADNEKYRTFAHGD